MSGKPPRIVSLDKPTRTGIIIRDHEEDSRGRKRKRKPSTKSTTGPTKIVMAADSPIWDSGLDEAITDPDVIAAEGDFEGRELDCSDCELDSGVAQSAERKVSGCCIIKSLVVG